MNPAVNRGKESHVVESVDERMACMEVWGGTRATSSHFVVPGLDVWVYSQPHLGHESGGDVYYLSSCASGRITRMLVGDVSGHGAEASPVAAKLRDIMRKNVNYIDQSRVVRAVNAEFEAESAVGRFATALICTYFAPTKRLSVCSAGHPPPLIYRKSVGRWEVLGAAQNGSEQNNVPIGVLRDQEFVATEDRLHEWDLLLAYTDALFEARDREGQMLSSSGLQRVAGDLDTDSPEESIDVLRTRLQQMNADNLSGDDVTIILARANNQTVTLGNNLLAPLRLVRGLFR